MPDLLATVQGRIDPVSVTVSGEFKHYTRMSGQGYPECHLKDWPMTSPGARYCEAWTFGSRLQAPSVKRRAKRAASDKRQASSDMRQYVQFKKI